MTSVSPNSGSTAGGTTVTITGANFASPATVTFGGTAAANVVVAMTAFLHHGHNSSRNRRGGNRDGNGQRPERKSDQWIHL